MTYPNNDNEDTYDMVAELHDAVVNHMESVEAKALFKGLVEKIARVAGHKTDTDRLSPVRRQHDGWSSIEFVIEKMIGEWLIDRRPRF